MKICHHHDAIEVLACRSTRLFIKDCLHEALADGYLIECPYRGHDARPGFGVHFLQMTSRASFMFEAAMRLMKMPFDRSCGVAWETCGDTFAEIRERKHMLIALSGIKPQRDETRDFLREADATPVPLDMDKLVAHWRPRFDKLFRRYRAHVNDLAHVDLDGSGTDSSSVSLATAMCRELDLAREACFNESLQNASLATPARDYRTEALDALDDFITRQARQFTQLINVCNRRSADAAIADLQDAQAAVASIIETLRAGSLPWPEGRMPTLGRRRRNGNAPDRFWVGADVRITEAMPADKRPGKTVVVTRFAAELTALFLTLRDSTTKVINHMSRYHFYGDMAEAVNKGLETEPEADCNQVLLWAAEAASDVLATFMRRVETSLPFYTADSVYPSRG